ncbi:MAG: GNAT family N-acetyltransferase [Alphaproteobacteria bacterium]
MQPKAKIASNSASYRLATQSDVSTVLHFIRGLADYEKLAHEVVASEETLTKTLFGPRPYAECLLAEIDGKAAGFALFFHNYSTFLAKPGIYLEDLFVDPAYRGQGIGEGFFRELSKLAIERDCGRIEWWVLNWNEPAINFYKKLGAKPMDEWTVQRLDRKAIETLAS